jgi:hypothetical protein
MRRIVLTAAAFSLVASVAFAQATSAQPGDTSAQSGPQNPAVKDIHENNAAMPVKGANSFTMGEAKSQIEAKGYTHVARLKKDENGVWRGMATKDGTSGPVSLDYQGNVN